MWMKSLNDIHVWKLWDKSTMAYWPIQDSVKEKFAI